MKEGCHVPELGESNLRQSFFPEPDPKNHRQRGSARNFWKTQESNHDRQLSSFLRSQFLGDFKVVLSKVPDVSLTQSSISLGLRLSFWVWAFIHAYPIYSSQSMQSKQIGLVQDCSTWGAVGAGTERKGRKWFIHQKYYSARAAITEDHRLGGLNSERSFPHILEAGCLGSKGRHSWFFPEPRSLACRWPPSPVCSRGFPLRLCPNLFFFL